MYYKHIIRLGLCSMAIAGMAACSKELDLPNVSGEKKIALIGEFVAGDSFYLRAGQSVAMKSGSGLRFQLLNGLQMTLQDSNGSFINIYGYNDTFSQRMYTLPFSSSQSAKHGNVYVITATHPDLGTASAKVSIPSPIDALVTDTVTGLYNTERVLKVKVMLKDNGTTTDYYVIEALKQKMNVTGYFMNNGAWQKIEDNRPLYEEQKAAGTAVTKFDTAYYRDYVRQPVYTADVNAENINDVGLFNKSRRVLLKDVRFSGSVYETDVYVTQTADSLYDYAKGRVIVYIKSVSADYFKFLKSYETYDPAIGFTTFGQPVQIEGNVVNGMGMIGGVSQVKYTYLKDNWNY